MVRIDRRDVAVLLALAALAVDGCRIVEKALPGKGVIPGLAYAGDRPDAPPLAERGNATFQFASFDESGRYLVTVPFLGPPGLLAWDGLTGALLSRLDVGVPMVQSRPIWMLDGRRGRMLGQASGETRYRLLDLRSGARVAQLPVPEDAGRPAVAAGLVGDGNEVLFFEPGWLEVWQLDPPRLIRRVRSPMPEELYVPGCVGGIPATFNDKLCWEWSPDRQTLAVAYTPVFSPMSESHFVVIDAGTLEAKELRMPSERASRTLASFAFSPDNRWLAVGTDSEMLLYDRTAGAWGPATVAGDHERNRLVGPMLFSADSQRVVALEDQLQVSVYDVASGARLGRHVPEVGNWEGVFEASRDGSRIVIYKFGSDTFEVLDGKDAKPLGWVCPYFCNGKHNPEQAPYAISPAGASVVVSHRRGTAVWDTATDTIRFPLTDPQRRPLPFPYER